ncbi:uncharacterized protein LOC122008709 [Zingiber officinale]|uniref:Glycosyl transferase family 1 domain-containing protein n=1 Tax=Zingiber officinale TaxID=94328 RepID=A0A8J5FL28_ZINOF|nr:uncharacterized protein LOC122008709 [Zingiber officinale]KAG6486262.1 hypothetical protein ZIOFF_054832 [Zingiber officinale]
MEEGNSKSDLKSLRKLGVRTTGNLKPSVSGRFSPRNSPLNGRLHSSRTRRENKATSVKWLFWRSNLVVLWLMLVIFWAYIGFHVQSKWAHGDHRKEELIGYQSKAGSSGKLAGNSITWNQDFVTENGKNLTLIKIGDTQTKKAKEVPTKANTTKIKIGDTQTKKVKEVPTKANTTKKRSRRSERRLQRASAKLKGMALENKTGEIEEGMIPRRNTSYGLIVGPFGKAEDNILGWNGEKMWGTCDRKNEFAHIVRSQSFVLVLHELSMTGAPLSMMELASEILSCGGTVFAVVLSRKGGLLTELDKRGIKVVKDRAQISFKTAMKADVIIAGSAVCSSWIEQYLAHFPGGSNQIVWWIMENRREYFGRSKDMLSQVKMIVFLSESQSKQWLSWCEEEKIHLKLQPMIVPLSVNDELAFIAGIPSSLNTPAFSAENMLMKRNMLRASVRKEMGLSDNDMLVMSLSSINPTKGQRLFLESALLVAEHNASLKAFPKDESLVVKFPEVAHRNTDIQLNSSSISMPTNQDIVLKSNISSMTTRKRRKHSKSATVLSLRNDISKSITRADGQKLRNLLAETKDKVEQNLKVLIGSLGSKSNKVLYIKAILKLLSQHSNLTKQVLWTPATTRVASLYAAADVYVINAQGLGETFGRVTIEAMAFGLPVLGTYAGGTREIVEHEVTGLLHPVGREGIQVLAQNIQYLLSNPSMKEKMGILGRRKVQEKYLKNHMYKSFAKVLIKCNKIK